MPKLKKAETTENKIYEEIQIRLPMPTPGAFFKDTRERAILQNICLEYILLNADQITKKKLKSIDVFEFKVKYCDVHEMKKNGRPWHFEVEFNGITYLLKFKQQIIVEMGKEDERTIQL